MCCNTKFEIQIWIFAHFYQKWKGSYLGLVAGIVIAAVCAVMESELSGVKSRLACSSFCGIIIIVVVPSSL